MRPVTDLQRKVAPFEVVTDMTPSGDQPTAIAELERRVKAGTSTTSCWAPPARARPPRWPGSSERLQRPVLVMQPNKTLAAQFANELREMLPNNAVEYFVSYYDYYQPEAYVPQTDTYIEKDSSINDEVERLRHSATNSLLTRRDTDRGGLRVLHLRPGHAAGVRRPHGQAQGRHGASSATSCCAAWSTCSTPATTSPSPGAPSGSAATPSRSFPMYEELAVRIEMFGDEIEKLSTLHPLTGEVDHRGRGALRLPGLPLRRRPGADGARRSPASRPSWPSGWPSWSGRASCWRRSGCACAPPTTSR